MRQFAFFILCIIMLVNCGGGKDEPQEEPVADSKYPRVHIETEQGKIVLELWPDVAPNHVANFLDLVNKGFYTGLQWHRIIKNFVIQSGSPNNDISGHSGYVIPAEFSNLPHNPGTLSMARGHDPNSASCQFFICLSRRPDLDAKYTIFGRTVEGMDIVKKIGSLATDENDKPIESVHMVKVWEEGKPVPEKGEITIE
ncbi:MAG: peptidylprolyl isomerase [Candidatus Zixiibacteriota bacterium]